MKVSREVQKLAKVRWEDGTESDVLPVCSIQPNKTAVEEEVAAFLGHSQTSRVDLSISYPQIGGINRNNMGP